jgi:hypothetical protein
MRSTTQLFVFIVSILLSAQALTASVIVDGREWRQLTDTRGFSWHEVALGNQFGTWGNEGGVCPAGGGICDGTLTNNAGTLVDFTGWTWATVDEVGELFRAFNIFFPRRRTTVQQDFAIWPFFFFNSQFPFIGPFWTLTSFPNALRVSGLSATTVWYDWGSAYSPFVLWYGLSIMSTDSITPKNERSLGGVWLYRDVVGAVPIPSAFPLLAAGLAGLGFLRGRKAKIEP